MNGRSGKPRVGLLYATQDRYELARMALTTALEGIDPQAVDVTVLWLDGSAESQAVDFFEHFTSGRVTLLRQSGYRNLGAARTIQLGMNRLVELGGFDWIGMFESDCFFLPGWLDAGFRAVESAAADGVRVGAFTLESSRLRRFHPAYAKAEIVCASNAVFLPEAWALVPPASVAHNFPKAYFTALCPLPLTHPLPALGWDWIFAMALYHAGGFEAVTTPKAYVLNCGTADQHKSTLESMWGTRFAQNDFEAPAIYSPPAPFPRQPVEWHRAVRMSHAYSDAALLRCQEIGDLSYLSFDYLNAWFAPERNEESWWRWADGVADILIHNSSSRCITGRLSFELSMLDDRQVVSIHWNGEPMGEIAQRAPGLQADIRISPGINVLRFEPSMPGRILPMDSRRLAFSVVLPRRWFESGF